MKPGGGPQIDGGMFAPTLAMKCSFLPFAGSNPRWSVRNVDLWILILNFLIGLTVHGMLFQPAAAQTSASRSDRLKIIPNEPLTISAESLERDVDANLYIAEGDVDIKYRDVRLRADRVELNEVTGDMVAFGNVIYEEGTDILRADRVEFNINSELGIVYKGDAAIQPDQYITGNRIEKIGEKSFKIDKGSFTACSSPFPFWKFRSSESTITKGDYFKGRNVLLFIKGIPLLFTPYLIFPIKEERQTGFLVPDIGSSRSKGFHLGNTFFWAINEGQDLSLTHNFYNNRGNEFVLNYRYIFNENTQGGVFGRTIDDRLENATRGDLRFNHRQTLPFDLETLANINLVSDRTFLRDFDNSLEERTRQTLSSDLSITKRFGQNFVRLLFDRLENLTPSGTAVIQTPNQVDERLPELRFSSLNQRLFDSPVFFQQDTIFSSLRRELSGETQLEFSRLDINPVISLPLKTLRRSLTLTPRVSYRETLYTDDATTAADKDAANPIDRGQFGFGVEASGPKFEKIFDRGEDKSITKLKHLIEPSINYNFLQNVDQTGLPSFDSVDRVSQQNQISYSLTNRLLAKKKLKPKDEQGTEVTDVEAEPQFETKELVALQFAHGVDFTQSDFRLSNLTATLQVLPSGPNRLEFRTSYDLYADRFVSSSIDFITNYKNKLNMSVLWRRDLIVDRTTDAVTAKTQFLDLNVGVMLWDTVGIQYRTRFNVEDQERVEDILQFAYNAQCWSLIGNFAQQHVSLGTFDVDRRLLFTLEFKHLGKIGTFRF